MTTARLMRALSWWYSWTGLGTSDVPANGDLEDAVTNGYLQRLGPAPGDDTEMPFIIDVAIGYSLDSLAVAAGDDWPVKSDYTAARFWDPASEVVSGLSAVTGTGLNRVSLSWTDDPDIPTADSSWARSDTEVVSLRATSSGGTYSEVGAVDYGIAAYNDRDAALVTGNTYYYYVQCRSKTTGDTGALAGPVSAVAADGTI